MTTAQASFNDPELGPCTIRINARVRRITFRTEEEGIRITVPPGITFKSIREAMEQLRPRLRKARLSVKHREEINLNYRLDTDLFHLRLTEGTQTRFLSRTTAQGEVEIVCPPHTDFGNAQLQQWLRKVVEEALRQRAKVILPPRLRELSARHGLPFRNVRINSSTGRWGSCSARKDINLSYYLLLLPLRLVDYVLLHELAHTREMNHGPGFRSLLNQLTNGQASTLEQEMKTRKTRLD